MMFTTKTEYGLRALVRLAKNKTKGPLSLMEISKLEHISRAYLEHIFKKLKEDDIVKSIKGAEGGYVLSREPKKIDLFEIVEALEGPLAVFYCMASDENKMTCSVKGCLTRKVWDELQITIIKTLKKFKLSDLI
jgi:Rrf2 family transcriptional regulator, cysteine metabolism repressor